MKQSNILLALAALATTLATAQVTVNQNAPNWTVVNKPGDPVDLNWYEGTMSAPYGTNCAGYPYNCEVMGATTDPTAGGNVVIHPYPGQATSVYVFSASSNGVSSVAPETQFGGCGLNGLNNLGNDNIYYFNPNTSQLYQPTDIGNYINPPASEFTISSARNNASGLVFLGNTFAAGSATPNSGVATSGAFALAAVYASSNRCSAGDVEYGFAQDLTGNLYGPPSTWIFYYSNYTNCVASGCTVGNSHPGPGVNTQVSPYTYFTNVNAAGPYYYYSAYIIPVRDSTAVPWSPTGYDFRVQILGMDQNLASCNINGAGPQSCTIDIPIGYVSDGSNSSLWPVNTMLNGPTYLIAATQTTAPSNNTPVFLVSGLWLGF